MKVAIIETGLANIASVEAALGRVGALPFRTSDPDEVLRAERVVLPGVGAFGPAVERLQARGLDEALRLRIAADAPLLGICLGMQLLCEESDESPGVRGLGILPARIEALPPLARLPHLAWSRVEAEGGWLAPGWAYFAHSYYLPLPPPGWEVARATWGIPFVAALRRGAALACQFHPELSGAWGLELLTKWVRP